jgi:hypothetical protein
MAKYKGIPKLITRYVAIYLTIDSLLLYSEVRDEYSAQDQPTNPSPAEHIIFLPRYLVDSADLLGFSNLFLARSSTLVGKSRLVHS